MSTGQLTVKNTQALAWLVESPANNTIQFNVAGFERVQGAYYFTAQSFGNGTFSLVFRGIPPVVVKGSSFSASYNYASNLESISYTASQTSGLQVIYAGVGPNIGNAVASGAGLLIALVIVISTAFILILIVWIKQAANREKTPPLGIQAYYPTALLLIALLFLVILALIALFTPYFNGIGI